MSTDARACTCHPDDSPPVPCPQKYALTDCRAAAGQAKWTDKEAPLKVGLHPPCQCARGRDDCRSLHQVISSQREPRTFICCGEVAPGCSPVAQDQWSFCIYGDPGREGVTGTDLRIFIDRVDMADMAAVLATGVSMTQDR